MRRMRTPAVQIGLCVGLCWSAMGRAQEAATGRPSAKATEALQLIESEDPYQRQLGFLRLEALREPAAGEAIRRHVRSRDPDMRAWTLRALAAIEGSAAAPVLLERLSADRQPRVRWAAVLGLEPLAKQDPAAILPALIKALRDRDTAVRIAAVDVVSRIDHPLAREAILVRSKREGRRDVRRVMPAAVRRVSQ